MLEYVKRRTGEYLSSVLQSARSTHPEYEAAVRERSLHAEGIENLLQGGQTGSRLDAYLDSVNRVAGIESELLYFQGYADCMELLRFLRVV